MPIMGMSARVGWTGRTAHTYNEHTRLQVMTSSPGQKLTSRSTLYFCLLGEMNSNGLTRSLSSSQHVFTSA